MGLVEQLAEELGMSPDELRDRIVSGDESLSANYVQIDPTGRISAQFSGHIQAQGIDMPETLSNVINFTSDPGRITWTDNHNVLREYIEGIGNGELRLTAKGQAPSGGVNFGEVDVLVSNDNSLPGDEFRRILLRDDGFSDYIGAGAAGVRLGGSFIQVGVLFNAFSAPASSSLDYTLSNVDLGLGKILAALALEAWPDSTWNGFRTSAFQTPANITTPPAGTNSTVTMHVENGATAQNFGVYYAVLALL